MGKKTGLPEFGRRLRELRKARGLSQEQLGDQAQLHAKFVGEIERGVTDVRLTTLIKLARGFGLETADFLAVMFTKGPLPPEARQVIDAILRISRRKDLEKLRKLKIFVDQVL